MKYGLYDKCMTVMAIIIGIGGLLFYFEIRPYEFNMAEIAGLLLLMLSFSILESTKKNKTECEKNE